MLLMEFLAPFSDDEEIDSPDQIAQLALDPMTAIFEKPSNDERQHLRLFLSKAGLMGSQFPRYSLMEGLQSILYHMHYIENLAKEIKI